MRLDNWRAMGRFSTEQLRALAANNGVELCRVEVPITMTPNAQVMHRHEWIFEQWGDETYAYDIDIITRQASYYFLDPAKAAYFRMGASDIV